MLSFDHILKYCREHLLGDQVEVAVRVTENRWLSLILKILNLDVVLREPGLQAPLSK